MSRKASLQACFLSLLRRPRLRVALRAVVRELRVPEVIRLRLPVDGTFHFRLLDRQFVYRSELHDGIGRALFWADAYAYEAETLDVLAELLREAPASATIFDVGANTGFYTLAVLALAPAAHVHAFEPVAQIASSLRENVGANGLLEQVHFNACAVAERSGTVAIHVPDETWHSATLSTGGFRGLDGHVEQVAGVALDDYVKAHGVKRVDVLKIDVEGHEDAVLGGARRILREHRPAVLCECLPELDAEAVGLLIAEFDYRAYHLRGSGPVRVPHVVADRSGRFKNYLLLPAERKAGEWLTGGARGD